MAVHETETPAYCSACFSQNPQLRHVDFDAAWDGPVLDHESGIKQVIDDLILCEECIGAAARLLGYVPASDDKMAAENQRLRTELTASRKARADAARRMTVIAKAVQEVA